MAAMFKSQDFLIATIPNDWPTESRIVRFVTSSIFRNGGEDSLTAGYQRTHLGIQKAEKR